MASDHDAAQHIDDLDGEDEETRPRLLHRQQHGLDVVLEEDAGDHVLGDLLALLRHGVLVRQDRVRRSALVSDRVDGGYDGEEVLEFVEVR